MLESFIYEKLGLNYNIILGNVNRFGKEMQTSSIGEEKMIDLSCNEESKKRRKTLTCDG
jgi:hypothetical protein